MVLSLELTVSLLLSLLLETSAAVQELTKTAILLALDSADTEAHCLDMALDLLDTAPDSPLDIVPESVDTPDWFVEVPLFSVPWFRYRMAAVGPSWKMV